MTYPCVDEDHFEVVDGALTPQPYMQWRHVATNEGQSVLAYYDVDGGSQAQDLYELQVSWTNPDPLSMNVYGLLTRGGSVVTTTARTRLYIETYFGAASGAAPADPTASTLHGRVGVGCDFGTLASNTRSNYGVLQGRQAERTSLLGSTVVLAPTQQYKLRVRLRIDAAFWETLPIDGGDSESELSILTGETRLDLFAYPVIP
jgi:hypothetical protein